MAKAERPDFLGEVQAIVSDKLQVVSYKWLSRYFSVSSNDAKRMLQEFVEQNGSGLQVLYTLSGWLKNSPKVYHVKLVSGDKLAELKNEFEDICSTQIYSVQACIPKDPAVLWNAEFVQAEELFDQPPNLDNCLRDNRFCSISNSFVQRNANGTPSAIAPLQSKNAELALSSTTNNPIRTPTVPQQQHGKLQQSSLKVEQSLSMVAPVFKSESNVSDVNAPVKAHTPAAKVAAIPAIKKKVQNGKTSSRTGGSLANLWGRASVKSESVHPPSETNKVVSIPTATAEAQICARESANSVSSDDDDDDDDDAHVNYRRASTGEANKKRRVIVDFSDEEDDFENAVNLASPDPPKRLSSQDSEHKSKALAVEKNKLCFELQKEDQSKIKQEKTANRQSTLATKEVEAASSKSKTNDISLSVKNHAPEASNQKDKAAEPKRRKVLKTHIDERGREVTEVVGEETESKNTSEKSTVFYATNGPQVTKSPVLESKAASNPATHFPKKSPAVESNASSSVVKAGAKKTGKAAPAKDPKQGNILSFFKKV